MKLTRKQVIRYLRLMLSGMKYQYGLEQIAEEKELEKLNIDAVEYAINSLKTDEAYQIMYEGGEIFTKDEVIAILAHFVVICEQELSWVMYDTYGNETDVHKQFIDIFDRIVQEKINALKEGGNEN